MISENMAGLKRTHYMTKVTENELGKEVVVMGWVQKRRNLGGLVFLDLRDRSGILQVVVDESSVGSDVFNKAEQIRNEFVVAARGVVRSRGEEAINKNMETGTIEVEATEIKILNEAKTPPFHIEADSDVKEDLRLKYRYLDLRRPDLMQKIILRNKIAKVFRDFLSEEGFIDIETPMLTKSTPEGARDYLVPSRISQGSFYALPQSPQIFKQLLMLSGFDKYYQITKCFRDEDLRADRQPEFTQVDIEMSFVEEEDVIEMNERLLARVFKDVLDVDIELPLRRISYAEAMERYGSDKPDLRFGLELVNVSDIVKDCDFKVFKSTVEGGGSVRGINAKGLGTLPRKQIDAISASAVEYGAKGMAWIAIKEDGEVKSPIAKFLSEETLNEIIKAMGGENGDLLLFVADSDTVVFAALSNVRLDIAKRLDLINDDEFSLCVVTQFPLVEWNEEQGRFTAMHHMFTAPQDEDIDKLGTDEMGSISSKAYDFCLNGFEIGGGSIRIHRRDVQQKIFDALGFTPEDAHDRFGFMLDAFEYGVPPHGGVAYGLDRVAMIMTKSKSIRDVIAFPKVKDASCPLTEAPGEVDVAQLDELGLKIVRMEK